MKFSSFKIEKEKREVELELKILKESINEDLSTGDRKILENKIQKLEKKLEELTTKLESTVSADIATTQMNLFADCTGKEDCECGRCQLLRKEKLKESKEFSPFAKVFGS